MNSNWRDAAERVAATLRADAAQRERTAAEPRAEVALLRESGLLTLLVPTDRGGSGAGWLAANEAARIVAAADGSVGHLLGYHYLQLWRTELFDRPELVERLQRGTVSEAWFWAGVSNPLDADLKLSPVPGGYTVDGRKYFATGASVADRLVVSATRGDTGAKLTFVLDARAEGVSYLGNWDNLGQRLTASGGVEFTGTHVPEEDVLGGHEEPGALRGSLAAIGFQLMLTQVYLGIAEGALAEAAEYTRTRTRPWALSGVDSATADPYILAGYGELVARTRAAAALTDIAAAALGAAFEAGTDLTPEQRGEAAVAISSAKVVATRLVNDVTTTVFEFVGARATANSYGFDRFWRNARTLTLHDPVSYKAREVGAHFLTGDHPEPTGYS
ncbi:acyl-CoA dehydrogenase family protein [Actinophytocola xanthii]|uniref:Acyl-CoA dehydrogenase n=1 Tax=Actinophytocola xanthii TaxID=1912961 RepID=A0A1Q8CJT5_9PSEU|nr:acyl-CoA dehydrogenase family protein [Actinophytocola xanthii]OLF14604.1 acyl-CoA dehydrogenase [Actinophytocola xanthii]